MKNIFEVGFVVVLLVVILVVASNGKQNSNQGAKEYYKNLIETFVEENKDSIKLVTFVDDFTAIFYTKYGDITNKFNTNEVNVLAELYGQGIGTQF